MDSFTSAMTRWLSLTLLAGAVAFIGEPCLRASNHLDSPTAIANPQADIGDIYAWMTSDASHLNLVMTVVGHTFSDRLQYGFHIDSGKQFGKTTASTAIVCRFFAASDADCRLGNADAVRGDASNPAGLEGNNHLFRVFAGLRDDPFFNNVRGTRAAYQVAAGALKSGAVVDAAGCPNFDEATTQAILYQWRHTDGGPGKNFLAGWMASALVISVDVAAINQGGRLLAVWGDTSSAERRLNREGRPMSENALLGLLEPDDVGDRLKEEYNALTPATSRKFIPEMQRALAIYDGFDGRCGNQLLANPQAPPAVRYRALATVLADDRLWINSASGVCTQLFAVELASLAGRNALANDCGGRTPLYNAANVWRALMVNGTTQFDDGLRHDDREHSATDFPFLAPPGRPGDGTKSGGYRE
jgi:hypothetical protein